MARATAREACSRALEGVGEPATLHAERHRIAKRSGSAAVAGGRARLRRSLGYARRSVPCCSLHIAASSAAPGTSKYRHETLAHRVLDTA